MLDEAGLYSAAILAAINTMTKKMEGSEKMQLLSLSDITVNDRQRSQINPEKLADLKASIIAHGLLHAIVVSTEGQLIAGGRRMAAISQLHQEGQAFSYAGEPVKAFKIPATVIDASDTLKLKEIELDENLIRENLSWQDETKALAEIHALRKISNPEQTYIETSKEVISKTGSNQNTVALSAKISRAMITSQFLDDPEVKNAANEKLAFNAAARKIRNEFASQLGDIERSSRSPHTFVSGDATVEIGNLSGKFRCFILDPPYGVGADKFGDAAQGRHNYKDDRESAAEINSKLIIECTKIAAPDAHLWLFCDIELMDQLKFALQLQDWHVFRTPLIWNSGTSGHVPNQKVGIRRNYELILFAYRDPDRGLAQVLDDVIKINSRSTEGVHGAAKPLELYELLLRMSCLPGDAVLDPTCGSGVIFKAAHSYGAIATGIELDPRHAENCAALLKELEDE